MHYNNITKQTYVYNTYEQLWVLISVAEESKLIRPNIVVISKNVHSVLLFKQIDQSVRQGIQDYLSAPYLFAHDGFREAADDFMFNLKDDGLLRTYDVICDHRNNPVSKLRSSIVSLILKYREAHCITETEITYTISY